MNRIVKNIIFCFLVCALIQTYDASLVIAQQDLFGKDKSSPFYVSPVVSVIISGLDDQHIAETLENAVRLSKKVPVRNILILHKGKGVEKLSYHPEMESSRAESPENIKAQIPQSPFKEYFKELGLYSSSIKANQEILERLKISYSPTWIVRFEGKEYVFEGYANIHNLFSSDGSFLP